MMLRISALLFVLPTLVAPSASAAPTTTTALSSCQNQLDLNVLTSTQLASMVIVPTVNAISLSGATAISVAGYGGVMISGNVAPSNFATNIEAMQSASIWQMPLYVMTDAEGGGVMRLANALPSVPWAKTMGSWSASRITAQASSLAQSLHALGINMDLAPVADVDARNVIPGATNPDGLRSFSGNPRSAATGAVAFMAGLKAQLVTPVAKHFPGIGYSSRNSDYGPATTKSWRDLQATGLVPFKTLVANHVPVIMMSNDWTPELSSLPASVSPRMYNYLRNTLNFSGLTITDSLSAGAFSTLNWGLSMRAVQAIGAGADLLLLGGSSSVAQAMANANAARDAIASAVLSGKLPLQTLRKAASAVWAAKANQFCLS
jgi:beta-N-acetylhexosaminidase